MGSILVWSSEEYIKVPSTLPFTSDSNSPERRDSTFNENTYAILTGKNETHLTSMLFITATLDIPTASIKCENQDFMDSETIDFTVLGM